MLLNKEGLLIAAVPKSEEIELPDGIGSVRVRGMTGWERDEYIAKANVDANGHARGFRELQAWVAATCLLDEDNKPMFDSRNGAVKAVNNVPAKVLMEIYNAAIRLTGLDDKESAEKNS